jgi:suppressor of fused
MNDDVVNDEDLASGWDAIDAALLPIYGDAEPLHWGTVIKYRLGGPDPLDGVSAYRRDAPVPHWHLISYGMSELYEKESDDPEVSGWGFEFTIRVARKPTDDEPPLWAVSFFQNLARYVFDSGNVFESGHHMNLNGPIALDNPETIIRAIAFAEDPELPALDTPNGKLQFLQIVGISVDELQAVLGWNTEGFLTLASDKLPLLVTDLDRASLLGQPDFAAAVEAGTEAEGSSTFGFFVDVLSWADPSVQNDGGYEITLGANGLQRWAGLFSGRLEHGRPMMIWGRGGQSLAFEPGATAGVELREDSTLVLTVTPELVEDFKQRLKPVRGEYCFVVGQVVTVRVVPSEIRDSQGSVVEVIG